MPGVVKQEETVMTELEVSAKIKKVKKSKKQKLEPKIEAEEDSGVQDVAPTLEKKKKTKKRKSEDSTTPKKKKSKKVKGESLLPSIMGHVQFLSKTRYKNNNQIRRGSRNRTRRVDC